MLTEDKKTNLKKPNKEKLLNLLNIPFIKNTTTKSKLETVQDAKPEIVQDTQSEKKKNKLIPRRCKTPLIKNKQFNNLDSYESDSSDDSSDSSSSASDKYPVKYIEITYDGVTYIYDNGNLYNKTKIGLKGELFGTFKNGKIRPNENEIEL
jgi:hypothetical protein